MKINFLNDKLIFIAIAAAILFTASARPSFAARSVNIDGILFSVTAISYGEWSKPRHHMVNDMVEHTDNNGEALSYIAISYSIKNNNESMKLDLGGKIEYKLSDEFSNRYRAMRKPDNFRDSVLSISKNFPSLYPGEQFKETLFFEAPIANAKTLRLTLASDELKLSRPVELSFDPGLLSQSADPSLSATTTDSPDIQPVNTKYPDSLSSGPSVIKIVSPDPGVVWDQGETARIQVVVGGGRLPKNIILVAMDNTFNDPSPKQIDTYDINVPQNQPPGEYLINVIAQWPDGNTSSAVLKFFVKDGTPLGIL